MQVLIADDEAMTRSILARVLEQEGFEVVTVADGEAALEVLRSSEIQLVVSDWGMPRLDGINLCRAVRRDDFGRYVYFIMLTCHHRTDEVLEGLSAGADDFVSKPFNPQEIVVRLRTGVRLLSLQTAEITIFAMARLAESRDPETGAHLERVRIYCRCLAEQLQSDPAFVGVVDEDYLRLIFQTSPLHDIGKVAIPDCVLLKAGRLSDEEFDMMKTHTLQGAATLDAALTRYPNARFLRMARDIALTHHEKFDGSGYPYGLAGQDIPLCGRIVAVADVYDALTSRRVYKQAFTHQIARSIILEERGRHFDPVIVDAFERSEQQFIETRQVHVDEDLKRAA